MRNRSASASLVVGADGNKHYYTNNKETTYKEVELAFQKERKLRTIRTKNLIAHRKKLLATIVRKYPDLKILNGADGGQDEVFIDLPAKTLISMSKDKALSPISMDIPKRLDYSYSPGDAAFATYVDPVAVNRNERGDNVDLYLSDANCERMRTLANIPFTLVGNATTLNENHTVWVAGMYHTAAPLSDIFCHNHINHNFAADRPDDALLNAHPNIRIQNYSLNDYSTNTTYDTLDRDMDDYAHEYAHRQQTIFNSAGNVRDGHSSAVLSPAKAYNIITVGNYQGNYSNRSGYALNESSCYLQPTTGAQKPEMSGPGTDIDMATVGRNSGTSFSSPHTAAIAADRLSGISFLHDAGSPTVKAFMLATATQSVSNSNNATVANVNGVGAGGVSYNSQWRSLAYWWDNGGSGPFTSNGACHQWSTYLYQGEDARIAISWLVRGSYALGKSGSNALGFDLDMTVTGPSGSSINSGNTASHSRTNAYEMVDFTADVTGTYVTNVCRVSKRDSGGRFDFGFAVAVYQ